MAISITEKSKVSSEPFSVGTGAWLATGLGCLGPSMWAFFLMLTLKLIDKTPSRSNLDFKPEHVQNREHPSLWHCALGFWTITLFRNDIFHFNYLTSGFPRTKKELKQFCSLKSSLFGPTRANLINDKNFTIKESKEAKLCLELTFLSHPPSWICTPEGLRGQGCLWYTILS